MIAQFLQSMFHYVLVLTPIYLVLRFFNVRQKYVRWWRECAMLAFVIYCISIFSQTIIPKLSYENGHIAMQQSVGSNYVLFDTIKLYINQLNGPIADIAFYNLAGNVVLFIPFGFFIPLLWKKLRGIFKMVVVSIMIPIFIEGTQYFIGRSVDVDDVLLNAIAIFIGYIVFVILHFFEVQVKRVVTSMLSLLK